MTRVLPILLLAGLAVRPAAGQQARTSGRSVGGGGGVGRTRPACDYCRRDLDPGPVAQIHPTPGGPFFLRTGIGYLTYRAYHDLCYEITATGARAQGSLCEESTGNGALAGIAYDDPRSEFDGVERFVDINSNRIDNEDGPDVWYTDPFGNNARTEPCPGSIRQFIAKIDNTGRVGQGPILGRNRFYGGPGSHAPN